MNKKPARKVQLARETIRVLTKDRLTEVAGGTEGPTTSLWITTSPFPSRAACTLPV